MATVAEQEWALDRLLRAGPLFIISKLFIYICRVSAPFLGLGLEGIEVGGEHSCFQGSVGHPLVHHSGIREQEFHSEKWDDLATGPQAGGIKADGEHFCFQGPLGHPLVHHSGTRGQNSHSEKWDGMAKAALLVPAGWMTPLCTYPISGVQETYLGTFA